MQCVYSYTLNKCNVKLIETAQPGKSEVRILSRARTDIFILVKQCWYKILNNGSIEIERSEAKLPDVVWPAAAAKRQP